MSVPDTTDSPAVVVAGVDGSPNSRAALAWAAEEAAHRGCTLLAVTAWTLPTPTTGGRVAPPSYVPDASTYREQAEMVLDGELRDVLGDDAAVTRRAVHGRPVDVLVDAGRGARMLVVGARDGGGIGGLRIGSVAEQLVHRAPCPVLVVPARRTGRAG